MRHKSVLTLILLAASCSGQALFPSQTNGAYGELPAVATEWTQYGFLPTHTSFNSRETTLTRANVAGLTWQWAGVVGKVGTSFASAAVVGRGIVYVAADGMIFAFRADDGKKLWSHLSCSGVGTVQAALGAHALLVGDAGGDLAAYDPVTGNQIWCRDESGSITSAPAVNEGTVYITNGHDVVATGQLTGVQRWRFTPADFSPVTNTPALGLGVVYVTGGNSVFALNNMNGHLLWRANLGSQANISAPSVAGGTVYVGGTSLFALDATTGRRRWVQHIVGVNVTTPAIAYRKVFVNSQDPDFGLWAFDAITGAFLWRREAPEESGATVTVANGVVYDIADTGKLMMFNTSTGASLGSIVDPHGHRFNSLFGAQPAVLNGTVYVQAGNRIDAFRLPQARTFAYVTNLDSNTVSVIDTTSNTVTATVPVGTDPLGVVITPDGTRAYVTNVIASGTVSVIDTTSNTVTATVPVGDNPAGVAITPDGTRAYVINAGTPLGSSVSVIDTASNTVAAMLDIEALIWVAITPDGTRAYTTNFSDNDVEVIDTTSNTVTAFVPVGDNPYGVAITPDGTRAYVVNLANTNLGDSVSVIDTASDTVTATVPVGLFPKWVAITPDGTRAYVTNSGDNSVSVIATATNTVTATVLVGTNPFAVAITPDGTRAYVTNSGDNSVSVIDTASNTVTATVAVGTNPTGVAITPGIDPPNKNQCQNRKTFAIPHKLKNQGNCVSFVNHGK